MGTRPQMLTTLADSPAGLATFMIDHDATQLELIAHSFNGVAERRTHAAKAGALKRLKSVEVDP